MDRASSFSSITDSTLSLNIITVTLNMDTVNFLGISIVGQSNKVNPRLLPQSSPWLRFNRLTCGRTDQLSSMSYSAYLLDEITMLAIVHYRVILSPELFLFFLWLPLYRFRMFKLRVLLPLEFKTSNLLGSRILFLVQLLVTHKFSDISPFMVLMLVCCQFSQFTMLYDQSNKLHYAYLNYFDRCIRTLRLPPAVLSKAIKTSRYMVSCPPQVSMIAF